MSKQTKGKAVNPHDVAKARIARMILTPNTNTNRKDRLYHRVPIEMVPANKENVLALASAVEESRNPEVILSIAERRARRVLEVEGIRPVESVPKTGASRTIPTIGLIDGSTPLSERAEIASSVLWAAHAARDALKSGDAESAVVDAVRVGMLSERMLILPFEAEVVRLASNRSKGGKARAGRFASRNAELASRVESLVAKGLSISKAAARVAAEFENQKQRIDPKTAETAYRAAFRSAPR